MPVWGGVRRLSGRQVVDILDLGQTGVGPPSACCSGGVFGGFEGGERVGEGLVADVFQGVQEDLVVGLGRYDLDVADTGMVG